MNDDSGYLSHDGEKLYQKLFSSMNEGLAICEIIYNEDGKPCDYRYLEVNQAFERISGITVEQIRGKARSEFGSIDPYWLELFAEVVKTGEPASRLDYSSETGKWCDVRAFNLGGGKFAFHFVDVTRYKQMENKLRESEQKYKELIQNAPVGIYKVDFRSQKFVFVNDFMCKQLGYTSEELLELSPFNLMDDQGRKTFQTRTAQWLAGEKPDRNVEYKVITKGGRELYAVLNVIFETDENGKPLGAIVIVHDITERKLAEEALRQSNERFSILVGNLAQVVWEADAEGRTVNSWSSRQDNTISIKDSLGYGWLDKIHPHDLEFAKCLLQEALMTGCKVNVEVRLKGSTGEWKWTNVHAAPIRDLNGNIIKWVGMDIDISERKRVEAALRESEEHLRLVVQTARMFTWEVDVSHKTIQCAENAKDVIGFPLPTTIAGLRTLPHPDDRAEVINIFKQAAEKGGHFEIECRIISPFTKEVVWLLVAGVAFINTYGFLRFIGVCQNITERKLAEAEVLASERELLKVTLNSLGEGVIAADSEDCIIFANNAALSLTGNLGEEVIGEPLAQVFYVISDQTGDPIIKLPPRIYNGIKLVTRDLRQIPIALNTSPIKDTNGQVIGTVIVFQDISEKLKIERELIKAEKLESLGVLAGGIAHDFNNILAAILANIQLAMIKLEKHEDIKYNLINTMETTKKASELTKQLLTFSRGGAPVKKDASLIELIKDTTDFILRGSKIKAKFTIPENLWTASIDEGQISQVLHNLAINAKQAMPNGGVININAKNVVIGKNKRFNPGNYIRITFKDHGIGIPEKNLSKIFDPFFTTKEDGNGLGLATAYSVITQHNGFIEVESKEGKGTTFIIYLPASKKAVLEEKIPPEAAAAGIGLKILLMDDEETILGAVGEMLECYGHQVVLSTDGTKVIEYYQQAQREGEPFNVVIMDLTIPGGMGGQEAMAHLKDIDPNVKVIISTGYANDPIISNSEKYGFSGVVTKPYNFEELITVLNEVIDRRQLPLDFKIQ